MLVVPARRGTGRVRRLADQGGTLAGMSDIGEGTDLCRQVGQRFLGHAHAEVRSRQATDRGHG